MKIKYFTLIFLLPVFLTAGSLFAQSIKMNEIFSRGTPGNLDWIEVYNNSASPMSIGGYKIYDNGGQAGTKPKKLFASGTIIPANGFFVIITDTASFPNDSSGFGLSSGGEKVWLEDSMGTVIDTITFPALGTTQSYGRAPDGGNWKILNTITRGKSNVALTSLILPQFIQGLNGTNNNRVPYAYRVKIENLLPSATYRYINQVTISTDAATSGGAGNVIFVSSSGTFTRTSSTSFTTPGQYGEFTTDANGSYTGWFITEPTGNVTRFIPGKYIFMRIRINDGAGGTVAVNYLTTADSVRVLNFYNNAADTSGTAIWGSSSAAPKDFVFLYDNEAGTGRPISGTLIESDGVDNSAITTTALFYRDSVDNRNGNWGTIIPNLLSNGIRRIERRLFADGSIHPAVATDPDGIWPSGANTVNPSGGLTPIRIQAYEAPMPVELLSFSASVQQNSVILTWKTATELNNRGFYIERRSLTQTLSEGEGLDNWLSIGFVNGNGTSTTLQEYSFTDNNLDEGKYSYRLKQIDINGSFDYSNSIEVDLIHPHSFYLEQNYPNPFNPSTHIRYSLGKREHVQLKIFDMLGNQVAELINEYQDAGIYLIQFSTSKFNLSSGTYLYELRTGDFVSVKKMLLMK